jgi:hypothetical protein
VRKFSLCAIGIILFITVLFSQSKWELVNPAITSNSLSDIIWTGSEYIISGGGIGSGEIFVSSNGIDWKRKTKIILNMSNFTSLTKSGDNIICCIRTGGFFVTKDSSTGIVVDTSFKYRNKAIVSHGKQIIAAGDHCFYISYDGLKWIKDTNNITSEIDMIKWFDNQYVAVGDSGFIATSIDGLKWIIRNSNTFERLNSIEYLNGKFVACGFKGVVVVSNDGTDWQSHTIDSLLSLYYIASNGKKLSLLAYKEDKRSGTILSSIDGIDWIPENSALPTEAISKFYWGQGKYFLIGMKTIRYSTDLVTWNECNTSITDKEINSVAWGKNQFVAVGAGTILNSENGYTWNTQSPIPGALILLWVKSNFTPLTGKPGKRLLSGMLSFLP